MNAAAAAVALGALMLAAPAGALTGPPAISATAVPSELALGATVAVSGQATDGQGPAAGVPVALETSFYPFGGFAAAQLARTGPDGTFSFAAFAPTANARLRVTAPGSPPASSPTLQVTVDPLVALSSRSLGPGRVRLSVRIAHGNQASPPVAARWYTATRGSRVYHLAATTRTSELPGGVTSASAVVNPPTKRFSFRVCVNPAWEAALGPPGAHGRCPPRGFRLAPVRSAAAEPRARAAFEYGGEARGIPLPPFPSAAAIASARGFLAGRAGHTAFAVLDSAGTLSGLRLRDHFESASVVKVMFLTAYLQMLQARHLGLRAGDRALLYPMIHESSNGAASAVLSIVGGGAVARVAREAGMLDYAPGVGWWAFTQTSAADQARFFAQLARLIPSRYYGYARYLMSTIEPEQSWGVPPVARPRWHVYFKTGALPSRGLFHEAALLERGAVRFTVAVFTDGDPSMAYGEQTIEGVASRLLGSSR